MNFFFIILGVLLIIYILYVVVKNKFNVVESVFWIIGAILILVLSIFPQIIVTLANMLGVYYPPSLLFLLVAVFLLVINFRNSNKIAKQNEMIMFLGQEIAILKEKNCK